MAEAPLFKDTYLHIILHNNIYISLFYQVGSNVTTLSVGDRVAIEPTQPCRACEFCKCGRYNLCYSPQYCSSLGVPGNLCRYYKHVADFCHKWVHSLLLNLSVSCTSRLSCTLVERVFLNFLCLFPGSPITSPWQKVLRYSPWLSLFMRAIAPASHWEQRLQSWALDL